MTQQNPSPLDTSRPGIVSKFEVDKEISSTKRQTSPELESVRGQDLKKARGINQKTRRDHHEAGTDEKINDAQQQEEKSNGK